MPRSHRRCSVALVTRVSFIYWPCRDTYSASLYPLPPGRSRREEYCANCTAASCLFGGSPQRRRSRRQEPHWAMPGESQLEEYIAALRSYTDLLRRGRTCWRCANLYRLEGEGQRYACPFSEGPLTGGPGPELAFLNEWQAHLRTAVEGCRDARFTPRQDKIERLSLEQWQAMLNLRQGRGRCEHCQLLSRSSMGGRERFVCSKQAEGLHEAVVWRLARSWRTLQARQVEDSWCGGKLWQPRLPGSGDPRARQESAGLNLAI